MLFMRSHITRLASLTLLAALAVLPLAGCSTSKSTVQMRTDGDFHFQNGEYDLAAREYAGVIDKYPGDWQIQYRYGVSQLRLGNDLEARRALEIAHTRRPRNADVAEALAEAIFRLNDESRLFAFLRERAESTQTVRSYLLLGRYSMEMGDHDSAQTAIDTAIALDNNQSVEPYLLAAELAERLGQIDTAAMYLTSAYHLDSENEAIRDRLRALGEIPGPTLGNAETDDYR